MNEKKDHVDVHKKKQMSSRRHFLKKAVYKAPAIIALGHLASPSNARAEYAGAIGNDPGLGTPKDFW